MKMNFVNGNNALVIDTDSRTYSIIDANDIAVATADSAAENNAATNRLTLVTSSAPIIEPVSTHTADKHSVLEYKNIPAAIKYNRNKLCGKWTDRVYDVCKAYADLGDIVIEKDTIVSTVSAEDVKIPLKSAVTVWIRAVSVINKMSDIHVSFSRNKGVYHINVENTNNPIVYRKYVEDYTDGKPVAECMIEVMNKDTKRVVFRPFYWKRLINDYLNNLITEEDAQIAYGIKGRGIIARDIKLGNIYKFIDAPVDNVLPIGSNKAANIVELPTTTSIHAVSTNPTDAEVKNHSFDFSLNVSADDYDNMIEKFKSDGFNKVDSYKNYVVTYTTNVSALNADHAIKLANEKCPEGYSVVSVEMSNDNIAKVAN